VLGATPPALYAWIAHGNLVPWSVLQGGGVLLIALLAARAAPHALPVRWIAVAGLYALAKLFELGDDAVWTITRGVVAGHALKHVVAAVAVWPVISALKAPAPAGVASAALAHTA
jgi:hypothetical protein